MSSPIFYINFNVLRLEESFIKTPRPLKYIDYSKDIIPVGNPLIPFFRKRKSFEHEKEIRVVFNSIEKEPKHGVYYKIDINLLIREIIIGPTAPKWYMETVLDLLKLLSIDIPVSYSTLDKEPPY